MILQQVWFNYQALWDLTSDGLNARLGDNLQTWMNSLEEIK